MNPHHPYADLPPRHFWRSTVANHPWASVFDGEVGRFQIAPGDRVATAGSCFAQRITAVLRDSGLGFADCEPRPAVMDEAQGAEWGYGRFSARFGNIYTPRQLRQLLEESLGLQPPRLHLAQNAQGRWLDLLRPQINRHGFSTPEEAQADRLFHLSCVRRMFLTSDVLVFTLGLTEAWVLEADGSVLGTHPSVATQLPYAPAVQRVNFDYLACLGDMVAVIQTLSSHNPRLQFVFTVSPVALAATHQDNHVLLATSYSKAILRAVVGRVVELCPSAGYFPSFELFNCAQSHGQYLSEDLRDVNPRGVAVAMALFRRMYLVGGAGAAGTSAPPVAAAPPATAPRNAGHGVSPVEAECDEVLNALFTPNGSTGV